MPVFTRGAETMLAAVKGDPAYEYNVRWGRFGNDFVRVLKYAKDPAKKGDPAAQAIAARVLAMIDESSRTEPQRVRLAEPENMNTALEKRIRAFASPVTGKDR